MLLLLAFVIAGFAAGLAVSRIAHIREGLTQTAFSIAAGLTLSSFLTLALSWALGELSFISVGLAIVLLAIFAFIASRGKNPFLIEKPEFGIDALAGILIFLIIAALNFTFVLAIQPDGRMTTPDATWVDYPFHLSIISSFAYGDNFPPTYPIFAKAPLTYPFMMNFLSSVFIVGGLDLRLSVLFGNLLFSFALIFGFIALARKVAGSKAAAAFAVILFLLNGNMGIVEAVKDGFASEDLGKFITSPPKAYSHLHELGYHFMNLISFVFVAERGGLMGFAICTFYYLLLFELISATGDRQHRRDEWKKMAIAGLLLASLGMVYPHALLAASIVSFLAVLPSFINRPYATLQKWLPLVAIAVVFAAPQIAWEFQVVGKGFIGYQFGWMDENSKSSLGELASFWLKNIWIVLILAIYGAYRYPALREWYLPFAALFLIANFIKFQPQDWDNIKVFIHWFAASCIIGGAVLAEFWNRSRAFKALALLLLLVATLSGILHLLWWQNDKPVLFEASEFEVAKWLIANTPKDAVFVTGAAHNHPVTALAGRKSAMGFGGQIWTQGITTEKYGISYADVPNFYKDPSCGLGRKLQAGYVFVGPKEGELKAYDNFEGEAEFIKIYERSFGRFDYRIYKIIC